MDVRELDEYRLVHPLRQGAMGEVFLGHDTVLQRDIKPANAILAEDGEVKLLDFGLAKLTDRDTSSAAPASHPPLVPPVPPGDPALAATADLPGPAPPPARAAPLSVTLPGTLLGTPRYMAPELWRGEPASPRSDLHALGAVLYELCAGQPPHPESTLVALKQAVLTRDVPPLLGRAPHIDPRLCAIIDRCLLREPQARFASAEDLCHALEQMAPDAAAVPAGNPYRGLHAFSPEHRALFFGRGLEIRAVLERLRAEPLVVVSGDSGVGKSSLCGAGVVPAVQGGALGEGRSYAAVRLVPGRRPLLALLDALLPGVYSEEEAAAMARTRPQAAARTLRQRLPDRAGIVLFIDQMEELLTQGDAAEAVLFAEVVAHLCDHVPGVRVLITARGDFLTRLAGLPGLGAALTRSVYVLRPLGAEELREVVTGPARVKGLRFESEALVQELVESTLAAEGGLPLLEFALAELWEARDPARQIIPAAALDAIGGVAGALARHADAVLAQLLPEQRAAARRLLLRLVTAKRTRVRRGEAELVHDGAADRVALEALVRGRLLVAHVDDGRPSYELAHEALVHGWATLRGWLEGEGSRQVARQRLEAAAAEWERLQRSREALLGERQLQEIR